MYYETNLFKIIFLTMMSLIFIGVIIIQLYQCEIFSDFWISFKEHIKYKLKK